MQMYDSAERLMNFAKYDTAGKPIFDERFAIFYPEKDTIQLGDKYKAEVRLSSCAYNENKMIIGSFTENYEVEDTIKVLIPQNYIFYYDTVPQDTGMYLITGHIHDIDHRGDSTIIDIIPFQQKFYVKP